MLNFRQDFIVYWKQLVLHFKVYQHLISSTLPLLKNTTEAYAAVWMKAASEEKRTKREGHTVSGLLMSVYTSLHEYKTTIFPISIPYDWRLSWDAGEQLDSSKIKGWMCFSHTSSLLAHAHMWMYIYSLLGQKKKCSFYSNEKW